MVEGLQHHHLKGVQAKALQFPRLMFLLFQAEQSHGKVALRLNRYSYIKYGALTLG
jgi:hypothetical protein